MFQERGGETLEHSEQTQGSEAFGAYLKKLREGRRLSLDAVEELSGGFPEKVTKSHLSRIENGLALPSFPRLMAMSHIYGVPIASLAERYEIELLRGMKPVDLTGRAEADVLNESRDLRLTGRYGDALVLLIALAERPGAEGASSTHLRLQIVNCLIHLGRFESAKNLAEDVLSSAGLESAERLIGIQQFATCCHRLGRFTVALMALDQAEKDIARGGQSPQLEADLMMVRGNIHLALSQSQEAAECFGRAKASYEALPNGHESCRAGIVKGEALIESGEYTEAQQVLSDELRIAEGHGYERLKALAISHLCLLSYRQGDLPSAENYAIRSNSIARPIEFTPVVFRNSYYLWEIAKTKGDGAATRLNERALRTYLGRLESRLPEADSFRDFLSRGDQ